MCGRYLFLTEKNEKLKELAEAAKRAMGDAEFSKISLFEVFPGSLAFAGIYSPKAGRTVTRVMRWGFQGKRSLIINARSESCFDSSFFRGCMPCAMPASAYYEWSKDKVKYTFHTEDETFYLAGICRMENDEARFVILTEDANEEVMDIHPRMPVIFSYEDAKKWCACDAPWDLLSLSVKKRYYE